MQVIRVHRRSRWRIILADVASILGCWLLATFVVAASRYDTTAVWFCGVIAVVCSIAFAKSIVVTYCNGIDFKLELTNSRIMCNSPNQRLCPDFNVELKEITEVTSDSDGWIHLMTSDGSEITLSLARNFGAPVRSFAQEIANRISLIDLAPDRFEKELQQ